MVIVCDVLFVERKALRNCTFIIEVNCCYFAILCLHYTLLISVEPHCIGMYPDVFPTSAHISGLSGPKDWWQFRRGVGPGIKLEFPQLRVRPWRLNTSATWLSTLTSINLTGTMVQKYVSTNSPTLSILMVHTFQIPLHQLLHNWKCCVTHTNGHISSQVASK